jgi:hypothetical protein
MKTKLVLGAVAAAVAVFSQGAFAQTSPSRAEVKAEAKSGAIAPAGQGPIASQPSKMSDKTRDERKSTTRSDRSAGKLKPAGEAVKPAGDTMSRDDKSEKSTGSTTDRAMRKADTKAAVRAHKTQPAGESAAPIADPQKK